MLFCAISVKIVANDTTNRENTMNYLEITVTTGADTIEDVAAQLTAGGFSDLVLEDQGEFESFLEENRDYWDYIDEDLQEKLQGLSCIKLYIEQDNTAELTRLENLLETLRKRGNLGDLPMTAKPLQEENWEESWKENYPAQIVGEKIVVLPYWLSDDSGRLPVILDPGLTFGTGAHPSTRMVLETMEQTVKPGCHCLDLGSGSGILSIAALRLGATSAIGVDVDPKAEDIARENAAYNGFAAPEFTALTGNVLTDREVMTSLAQKQYDVVLVNIVADVIIALAPVLPHFLGEHTTLICSGILDTRLSDVKAALEKAGIVIEKEKSCEDWRCIQGKRR